MSAFEVRVGKKSKASAKQGAEPPAERKPIHPGIQKYPQSDRCLKCYVFLRWSRFGNSGELSLAFCECGLWVFEHRHDVVRWIRFSSAPALLGVGPLFATER